MKIEHLEIAVNRFHEIYHDTPITYSGLRHIVLEVKELEREEAEQEERNHRRALKAAFGDHGQD